MPRASTLVLLFFGLFGFYGFTAHGYLENTDADVTMHAARAWYLRGYPGLMRAGLQTWAAERVIASDDPDDPSDLSFGMSGVNGKYYVWFPIGHQMLMLPCIALGELFAGWFPRAEAEYLRRNRAVFGEFFWSRFFVSFIPAVASAGATVMVLLLSLLLGCSGRQAMLVAVVTTLCTQFWPSSSETMSDAPGTFFLLAMAVLVFRVRAGSGGLPSAVLAGVCGGWAVLVRYPHAVPVLVFSLVLVHSAWRTRRFGLVLALGVGALPEFATLLLANWLRFGSLTETGYSAGATAA